MSLLVTILSIVVVSIGIVGFYLYKKDFMKGKLDEKIPVIGSRGIAGFVREIAETGVPSITFVKHGLKGHPVTAFHVMGNMFLSINHPKYAQLVIQSPLLRDKPDSGYGNLKLFLGRKNLVALGGDEWVFQRRLLNKVFSSNNMHIFHEAFVRSAETMNSILDAYKPEETFDLHDKLRLLTMDVISESIMTEDFAFQRHEKHPLLMNLVAGLEETTKMNLDPIFRRYNPIARFQFSRATKFVSKFFMSVIESHRRAPADSPQNKDLIGLMLSAVDEVSGAKLTDEDILSQCLTFFFAGHDTTAATMSWVIYHICTSPEIEKKVLAEVDAVLGDRTTPNYEDLGKFKYLTCVIKETLRLFAPATQFVREAAEDVQLGEYTVKKGTAVMINSTVLHILPDFWPDPYTFDPERFNEENSVSRHPYSWLPFSAKERSCIGMNFAMMEIKAVLAVLFRKFVFRADNLRRPEFVYHVTSGPKDMIMHAVRR